MSASHADHQSNTSCDRGAGRKAPASLTTLSESLLPYGKAFCHFTRTFHEEVDWRPEAISLICLWMKGVQDLQVSDCGLGLITAYVRLDAIRNVGMIQGLLSADVAGRMNDRVKETFQQQGRRLANASSPNTVQIEGSVDLGDAGTLRARGATIH